MDITVRNLVERKLVAIRISLGYMGKYGREFDYYISGFRKIERIARNAADELEGKKRQLQIELDLQ